MPVIALVAAGARLGLSLGKVFGRHGFDVVLIARSKERLGELTGELAAVGVTAAGFAADVTDRSALTAALGSAAERFGRIDVLHYSSPGAGTTEALRTTGPLDVTVDNLWPQVEGICYGAVTATRAVLPAMLAAGAGTLLYTTGGSSVTPAPVFVSAGMAGAALRKYALTLNGALAGQGVFAGHVAIGAWIAGTPGAPEGASLTEPDDIARLYWDLHTRREPADQLISA
jgi:NADP-dependent 3-hydroxy acid dehydrogenase YdfG